MDHLVGTTTLLRPYMHGYFVAQRLYEEARLISNPDMWAEQRAKSVKERIDKERESRIRGSKKVKVKVNRKLAERILEREDKKERWIAKKVIGQGGDVAAAGDDAARDEDEDEDEEDPASVAPQQQPQPSGTSRPADDGVLTDSRFARLFQDEDFEVDETSYEFRSLNPSTKPTAVAEERLPKGLTAVEREEIAKRKASSAGDSSASSSSSDDDDASGNAPDTKARARPSARKQQRESAPRMLVSSSTAQAPPRTRDKSFGARAASSDMKHAGVGKRRGGGPGAGAGSSGGVVGEREVTFKPSTSKQRGGKGWGGQQQGAEGDGGRERKRGANDRRSASGNVFRRM